MISLRIFTSNPSPLASANTSFFLLVQLLQFGVQIFDPFDERPNLAPGNGDVRHGAVIEMTTAIPPSGTARASSKLLSPRSAPSALLSWAHLAFAFTVIRSRPA